MVSVSSILIAAYKREMELEREKWPAFSFYKWGNYSFEKLCFSSNS